MTALSLYFSNQASTTITTADQMYVTSGSPTIAETDTTIGKLTGWGQLYSQGTGNAWPALSSIGSPDGHGFLLEQSVLNLTGDTISAGNWSGSINSGLKTAFNVNCTYTMRVYKYSSSSTTYTNIVTMTSSAQSFTTSSAVTVTFPATSGISTTFTSTDFLYVDIWINITSNSSTIITLKMRCNHLSTDTSGLTGDALSSATSPGYTSGSGTTTTETITESATGTETLTVLGAQTFNITESATGSETISAIITDSNVAEYDSFIRSSTSNGWGIATDGDSWYNRQGSNSSLSTSGTVGQLVNSGGTRSHITLGDTDNTDQEITGQITPYATADDFGVSARMSGDATINGVNGYRFHMNGASALVLYKITAGTGVQLGVNVSKTITAGTSYSFRFRAVGPDNGVHLQGRMWATSTTEPTSWDIDQTDATGFASGAGGFTGIASDTTNAIQYSNFALTNVTPSTSENIVEDANPATGSATTVSIPILSISETAQGSEQVSAFGFQSATIVESATGSEIMAVTSLSLIAITETSTGSEIVSLLGAQTFAIVESDNPGTGSAQGLAFASANVSEVATGSEAVTTFAYGNIAITENVSGSEAVSSFGYQTFSITETPTGTETISALGYASATIVESATGQEQVSAIAISVASILETAQGSEIANTTHIFSIVESTNPGTGSATSSNIASVSVTESAPGSETVTTNTSSNITAFTAYLSAATSSTLTTANKLYTASGTPTTQENLVPLGTATGYSELVSQGTTAAWAALGSIGGPSGNGWFYDANTLDLQAFVAGNWSATIHSGLKSSGTTATVTYYLRAYRYSAGTYTNIVTLVSSAQNFTNSTAVDITLAPVAGSSLTFAVGDRLYIDLWSNCSSNNAGNSAQKIRIDNLSLDTTGFTGNSAAAIVSPGYAVGAAVTSATITETAQGSEQVSLFSYGVINPIENAPGSEVVAPFGYQSFSIVESTTGSESVFAGNVNFAIVTETAQGSEVSSTFSFTLVTRTITESVTITETVTASGSAVSNANAQMMLSDLNTQYSRIMATAAWPSIKILATTYYGNSTNNQLIYGELDALLKPESISQLHVMRTINDVTNFLKSYEYQTNVLADAPIAYYPLNETSGAVAYDIAGNKYNGLINNSVVLGQPGALSISPDTSMQFSAGAYVTLPGAVNTANWNALTIEAWIKPTNISPGYTARILSNDSPPANLVGVELGVTNTALYFTLGTGAAYTLFNPSYTFSTSSWYHLVAVYAYANMYLYINGAQVATQAGPSLPVAITTNPFYISKAPTTTTEGYPGYIDEVAIYNTALSPARVAAHYNAGINPT